MILRVCEVLVMGIKMREVLVFVISYCFINEIVCDKTCNNFEKCGTCIGFSGDQCVWCSEANITESRCQPEQYLRTNQHWCDKKFIYNPDMAIHKIVKNDAVGHGLKKIKPIQFQPQELNLNLRPGALYTFQMSYKPAEDFPLDVYYLMDYSYTMKRHVGELQKQAKSVYKALSEFSNNVRFGVGSFVEKPEYPFVDPQIQYSYSFKNHLSLTKDMDEFIRVIENSPSGSNYDLPEAGLDGLMQVMACKEELLWRSEARRIIILCTDAPYHSAGDGKMVGAWKPNDMKCHLNASNFYDYSLLQDYPSVSQLNKMASEGNFKIIFAALGVVRNEYELLAKQIFGSKYAELEQNSNIVAIIKAAYMESITYTMIKHQWPSYVQLKLEPDCTKFGVCEIKHQQILRIKATIQVTECPENKKKNDLKQILNVGPVTGGLEDKLKINLEIDCECECEKSNTGLKNSPLCSSSGTLRCGICECNKDRSGSICQCDGSITSKTELEKCKLNVNDTHFCNGKGTCVCGKCSCDSGFSGNYCEFDDKQCDRRDDQLCSGHGRCTLGSCHCSPEWTGDDCSCTVNTVECFLPFSKEICSGNGECMCGECVCRKVKDTTVFIGSFCDDCDECADKRCKELENYVDCNYWNNKTYCDQLQQQNQTFITEIQMLNKSEINNQSLPTAKWCYKKLENGTSIAFMHNYDKSNKKLLLLIQEELEEESKQNIWIAVGIAIGTVLLIGLLTVIAWKVVMDKMDEKEYNNFMKKAQEAGFDVAENPIYQPAATSFSNPTYFNPHLGN